MARTNCIANVGIALAALLVVAGYAWAEEHPAEHPAEHPTAVPGGEPKAEITKEALGDAIEAYINKDAELKGGFFLVYDPVAKKPLVLTLVKIHRERLSKVGKNVYFACTDLKTPHGDVYDLDFFMKGSDRDHLKVTEVSVHKEAGKARYTWHQKGGVWEKKPVGKAAPKGEKEHPAEHPEGGEHPAEHPS